MDEAGSRHVLVGREQVLHTLRTAVDDTVSGRGGLTLLAGEPGVGKTRVAEEICDYSRSRGAAVAWGSCWEGEGAPGFWPWLQVLRALTDTEGNSLLDELGATTEINQLVPDTLALVRQGSGPFTEIGQERFRLFDAVGGLLREMCRSRPVVAVLDDLHWSDAPSLRLLRFLAQDLRSSPILILGAYRDVEVSADHPLAELLGGLTWCRHVPLSGLPQHDVARLVSEVSGIKLTEQAAETLRAATNGNPFFIREIASFLTGRECLFEARASEKSPANVRVPGDVAAVINRRVDRLPPPCVRLLEAAAVLGQEFDLDVLSAILDQPDETSLTQATEAVSSGLLASAPNRFRFRRTSPTANLPWVRRDDLLQGPVATRGRHDH